MSIKPKAPGDIPGLRGLSERESATLKIFECTTCRTANEFVARSLAHFPIQSVRLSAIAAEFHRNAGHDVRKVE